MKKYWIIVLVSFILSLVLIVTIKTAINLQFAIHQAPLPQAFLVLGGDPNREEATAELASWYPNLDIWISSGSETKVIQKIFQTAGISLTRVHIDQRAVDTVTNFTTLVADFKEKNIQHLYLVTSDYHMPRASAIASLVLGSQGIVFTPVSLPANKPRESTLRILRDILRSLLWIFTGYTGGNL